MVPGTGVQVVSAFDAVIVKGCPELQLKMPPNCHRSTIRETQFGAPLRNLRFGPNGSSNVPLLRKSCVRWKGSRLLFSDRFRGSQYSRAPSMLFSPSERLHVYAK